MSNREGAESNASQGKSPVVRRIKSGSDCQRPSTTQKKKSEFFEKNDQFEQKLSALEKERNVVFYSRRSEFRKEFCLFEEMDIKTANERKGEKQKLRSQLGRIRTNVLKFQRDLVDVKPSPAFVEKLKETMEEIESSMMSFKEQQRKVYDDLMQEEKVTQQEVTALEKKFESWSTLPAAATAAAGVKRAASAAVTADLPPAVAAFERFLIQTGGHQGGWDDYDHQLFLKLRTRHKNKDTFLQIAGSAIPGRHAGDVRQHEEWYTEYQVLKEKKRVAIAEWKTVKNSNKEDLVAKAEQEAEEEENWRKIKEERAEKEKAERFAKISDWKVQRDLEKAKLEEKRLQEKLRKTKEKEKEEKRRLEIKAQVEEFARQRAEEEAILRAAQEERDLKERMQNKPTSEDLARVQERSQKLLEGKQTKIRAKEVEKEAKEKRLQKLKSQVEVNVTRDPSRLYKLTQGWEQRKKEGPGSSSGGPLLNMPHKAIPSWRQGP